jgi:hypothetical protein
MRIPRLESRPIGARLAVVTALLAAASLALAGPASANVGEEIIIRCGHVESLSGFSQSAYDQALKELEADAEEYSPCAAQIHAAQRAAAAGAAGAAGAPGAQSANPVAIAPSPSQRRAITHAEHAGAEPVKLGGRTLHPGVVHVDVASALSSLPTPLLVVMAFLLACALALAGGKLAKRVRDGRSH